MERILIFAPNWLGDAVMALPAIADVRRAAPDATVTVAARPSVAPLFALVPEVNGVVPIAASARGFGRGAYDVAILFPNSFQSALLAWRAGIARRWGYRTDCRGPLLTRAIPRPRGVHQVAYYQRLVAALDMPNGPATPRVRVPDDAVEAAARMLREHGWDGRMPLVCLAPGAAYGGAKRWPPEYYGELAAGLAVDGIGTVMIGSAADAATGREVARAAGSAAPIDLMGTTSLAELAGVFRLCRAVVSNDSGAMHLAAAANVPVTALFGPTDERATTPSPPGPEPSSLSPGQQSISILVHPTWCRPCMLRECPLDHACMRGITVARVRASVAEELR